MQLTTLHGLTLSEAKIECHKRQWVQDIKRAFFMRLGLSATMLASSAGGLYWWWNSHREGIMILAAALEKLPKEKIQESFNTLLNDKQDDSLKAWLKWIGSSLVSLPVLLVRKELSDFAYRLTNPYVRQIFKMPGARLLVLPPQAHAYLIYHSHIKTAINDIEAQVNRGISNEQIAQWLDSSAIASLLADSLEKLLGYCEAALPKLRDKEIEYKRALALILEMRTHISLFDPYTQPEKARTFYVELEGKIRSFADLQTIS
jgi:hypothetical protein